MKINDILNEGEVAMPTGQATGIDSQTDTPPKRSFSIKVVGRFIPSSSQTFTATQLFNALTSILPRDYPYVDWENQEGSPQRRVIDDINNDGFSIVKQGINSQDVAETIASKFEGKGIPAEVIDGGIYEEQLNEFLPALAAGAGALARGATVAGGAALKGAQALGGAAIKGVQAVAPGIVKGVQTAGNAVVKGVQAVTPGVVKTGQAIGKVPGQVEKGLIKGVEMLDALVPGGIFNPDGSMKGSQYLTKYLTPQQIQQAQQQSAQNQQQTTNEQSKQQKGADYRDPPEADYGDDFQDMVKRLKHLAGAGPLKTVYDPAKRVYKNVPTAQQPKK